MRRESATDDFRRKDGFIHVTRLRWNFFSVLVLCVDRKLFGGGAPTDNDLEQ